MDIRRAISGNPKAAMAASVVIIIVAVLVMLYTLKSGSGYALPESCWYSVDDGATWFSGPRNKMPFEHNGRPAFQVHLFDDGGGKPFAVYLERYAPAAEAQLKSLRGSAEFPPADQKMAFGRIASSAVLVKRVGAPDTDWVGMETEAGMRSMSVRPRSGASGERREVWP